MGNYAHITFNRACRHRASRGAALPCEHPQDDLSQCGSMAWPVRGKATQGMRLHARRTVTEKGSTMIFDKLTSLSPLLLARLLFQRVRSDSLVRNSIYIM